MVSGVTDWGMYVEPIESKCEGMVRYDKLYKVDTENYIVYTKTGNQ
jgi:ribonuclease R